jgi:leucyl aminopeptidase (aminopeptidase T)
MTSPLAELGPELAHAADVLLRDYMNARRGETLLITADTGSDPAAVRAVFVAAHLLGCKASILTLPQLPFQGTLADPYIPSTVGAAAAECDVWIDFTFPYLAGSHLHDAVMKKERVRYLLAGDLKADSVVRLFGRVDLDRYYEVHKGFDTVAQQAVGKECRITNGSGTDVTFTIGKPGFTKPRRAEKPGMYLVPGACTIFPEIETVRGTISVFATFHEYFTSLREPLHLIMDGRVRELRGGGNERKVMDRALRRAAGGDYGYVIHFTHGIHPAARVTGRSFIEDMRATGNNSVGLGLPWWVPGGGENHPDALVSMQSVWVDGRQIVRDGAIVDPPELAAAADALLPIYS